MDRANAALASYLLGAGHRVHLVGHEIDAALMGHPLCCVHAVSRPRGLPALAERRLSRTAETVARNLVSRDPNARVVVNGGNCGWPDINWVHAVHAAWPVRDAGSPWWSRYRNRRLKREAIRRERAALHAAGLVIANSNATRRAVVEDIGVPAERTHTVYLGSDETWGVPDARERAAARAVLGLPPETPVVLFVGALGTDTNKGFDLLWSAWTQLLREGGWDARLVVAGRGWRLPRWRAEAARRGLTHTVQFVGFSADVRQLLAAGDLLVSPVRYEAYGLNVHEALCRGLAVMVSEAAGVTELFDRAMSEALLAGDAGPAQIAARLRSWRADVEGWRQRAAPTAARLRARTWPMMARDLVEVARRTAPPRIA